MNVQITHDPRTNKLGIQTSAGTKATIALLLEVVRLLSGQLKEEPQIALAKQLPPIAPPAN